MIVMIKLMILHTYSLTVDIKDTVNRTQLTCSRHWGCWDPFNPPFLLIVVNFGSNILFPTGRIVITLVIPPPPSGQQLLVCPKLWLMTKHLQN